MPEDLGAKVEELNNQKAFSCRFHALIVTQFQTIKGPRIITNTKWVTHTYVRSFWGQCYQLNYGKNNMVVNAIASEFRIGEKKEFGKRKISFLHTLYVNVYTHNQYWKSRELLLSSSRTEFIPNWICTYYTSHHRGYLPSLPLTKTYLKIPQFWFLFCVCHIMHTLIFQVVW